MERYIYDTFIPCIDDPSKIAKWRIYTASSLFGSARGAMNELPFDYPDLSPSDLFKLSSKIFNEQMSDVAITALEMNDDQDDDKPSQVVKDIDRQICNNIRNEFVLSLNFDAKKGTESGAFTFHVYKEVLKKNEDAIMDELNKPLGDYSLLW